jgi:hypothetical protein
MPKRTSNASVSNPPDPAVLGVGFIEVEFPVMLRPRAVVELEGGVRILLENPHDVALAAELIERLRSSRRKGGRSC